jgi:predicted nucleic acid-binding protein
MWIERWLTWRTPQVTCNLAYRRQAAQACTWQERTGAVSTQVLQELYASLRRKAGRPLASEEARAVVADYLRWEVVASEFLLRHRAEA